MENQAVAQLECGSDVEKGKVTDAAPWSREPHNDAQSGPQTVKEGPVSSLPEEVLTLILNTLHLAEDHTDPKARLSVPRLASQVCSYWRFIALQNSLWWSCIYVTPPWRFEQLKMHLERSKECTLDMTISVRRPYLSEDEGKDTSNPTSPPELTIEKFESLGPILFPHFSRCRSLTLDGVFRVAPNFMSFFMESLTKLAMPHLESFTSDCEFLFIPKEYTSRTPLFTSAPRLHDLRLGGMSAASYAPPLTNITSLHLSRVTDNHPVSFSELAQLLTSCQSLTLLAIYDDLLNNWDAAGTITTCTVPKLESLFILGNMLSVSELLLFLDAPNLWELVIAPVIGGDLTLLLSQLQEDREKCIKTSRFPKLTKLTLAPAYCDAFNDALPSASTCFPKVETVIFANVYYREFIESFTDKSLILFPHLLDLGLSDVGESDVCAAIRQVVEFRKKYHASIRRVLIDTESARALGCGLDDISIWGSHAKVEVADLWEDQRKKAMYTHTKDLFVGRPSDEF
ncbi:hypothetical protein CPB83DRAFT_820420 [Crepidotus variabilis]|uniref:F-box domain-containing protein n=1 Tax=Crepidotus variabilis TaxID=179855 RepID=A0A9P6E837_9AGAR|nr:hypothetical protein CPB83DRAFT_820420 [Crepidotus variabilis]